MCGIVGKLNFNKNKQISEKNIKEMAQALSHRGPDDQGIYVEQNLGLGHTRLSVIDLSSAGHQPMSDNEKKIWIVYNGEIYNFLELRRDLEKQGAIFKSKTDTEVIIYLYKKYGIDCLKYLRGMFAFAIWDEEKRQLFLVRDRIGKKPLKYYLDSNCFIFASELKAILRNPEVEKKPDFEAVHHYLTYQYVPCPLTGFLGIKKLPPAHYMIVKENGESKIERYWKLDYSEKWDLSEKEWEEKILKKLEECVKLRLISDVPLGAFLSGGIDSSAIVALMSQILTEPLKTFSIGFKETDYDETFYARIVAKKFKTEHHEFFVKPDAIEILPQLAYQYEEPYADSSAIPTWYLSEMTRKYVTVALNGDGGDENFAGYLRYNIYKSLYYYHKIPVFLRKIFIKELGKLAAKIIFYNSPRQEKAIRFLERLEEKPEKRYLQTICYFNEEQKQILWRANLYNESYKILKEKFDQSQVKDILDRVLFADINSYLPDDLLVKADIASMAHSLEIRSPLLDHQFLELTAKIPSNLKLRGQKNKYIFKNALKNILPKEILNRKKMGFGVPLEHWFRKELKDYVKEILLSQKAIERGLFNKNYIEKLIADHQTGRANYANHLWALLTLEHWFRQYFD